MAKVEKTIRRLVSKNAALLFFLIWLLLWIKPKIQVLYPNQFHWMYRIDSIILLGLSWVLMSLVFIAPGFSIWIATIERIETIRKRRSDYRCVVSAAIAGISPAIAAFWLRIGVPPTSDPLLWGISIFFLVESAGIILVLWACVRLREFAHQLSWSRKVIGLFGLILVNCSFFFLPLIWTVLTARFASQFLSANKYEDVEVVEKEPVVLTHISDLHITNETLTKDGKQPGNRRLPTLLQKINALKPRYLVLSGDLTDEGKPDQWATLGGILEWNLSPGVRIVIAPGNHDLNRFFGADPSIENIDDKQAEITTDFSKIPRLARMVTFQSKYLPEMTNRDGIRLDALIRNIPRKSSLAGLQAEISKCADGCKNRSFPVETPEQQFAAETACELQCSRDWRVLRLHYLGAFRDSFPLMYVDEGNQVALFSLASVFNNSDSVGENAIGFIDDNQIDKFRNMIRSLPPSIQLIVVTLHHPLFHQKPPAFPTIELQELAHPAVLWDKIYLSDWFLSVFLQNNVVQAKKFYAVLSSELENRKGSSAVVMFGHRHMRSLSTFGNIVLEEAPNLATESSDDYGFYSVAVDKDSRHIRIHWSKIRNAEGMGTSIR